MFKRYREKFDTICPDIKYKELVSIQWPEEGMFTHSKASEAVAVTKKPLDNRTFKRDDYLDLTEMVYVFLTGESEINGKTLKFYKPHGVSQAIFMHRGLYYLTLGLLGDQASYMNYNEEEQRGQAHG